MIVAILLLLVRLFLSSSVFTEKAKKELEKSLQTFGFDLCSVHIQKGQWGGIWHPLSIQFNDLSLAIPAIRKDCFVQINQIRVQIPLKTLWNSLDFPFQQLDVSEVKFSEKSIQNGRFSFSMIYEKEKINFRLRDCDINASSIIFFCPNLGEKMKKMDLPLRGEGDFSIHPDALRLISKEGLKNWRKWVLDARLKFSLSGQGILHLVPFYPSPVSMQQLDVGLTVKKGKLAGITNLRFDDTSLQFGIEGDDLYEESPLLFTVKGVAHHIPLDRLSLLWPVGLATTARTWVTENLSVGNVPQATINMGLMYDEKKSEVNISSLSGEIGAANVTVQYLDDLPVVVGANGHCVYTKKDFHIMTTGKVNGLEITKGDLLIYDFDKTDERIKINLDIQGPLEKALDIISQKPLVLPQKLGLTDPTIFQGDSQTHLYLDFRLVKGLPLAEIDVRSHTKVENGRIISSKKLIDIAPPYDKKPLQKGELTILVDNHHLNLEGKADILSYPSQVHWAEVFEPTFREYRTQWTLVPVVDLDKEGPWSSFLQGKALLDISQKVKKDKTGEFTLKADLKKARLNIPYLFVANEKGEPLTAQVNARLEEEDTYHITKADLIGDDIDVRLFGTLKKNKREIKNLQLILHKFGILQGDFHISGNKKKPRIRGKIKQVDAGRLLSDPSLFESAQGNMTIDFMVDLIIDKVLLGPDTTFNQVACHADWDENRLQSLHIKATPLETLEVILTGPKPSSSIGRGKGFFQAFTFSSHNMGDFLDYIYPENDLLGGSLQLVGNRYELSRENVRYEAEMDVRDITVKKAPFLAQLLSAASLSGIFHTLSGSGIHFDHCLGKLTWTNDVLTLKNVHFSGGSLGLNFVGGVHRKTHQLDLKGELYPFNGVNYLIANIPLLGNLLSGGNEQGVFSIHFEAKGSMADPVVMVNPLTTFAPGGVRRVFREATDSNPSPEGKRPK